MLHRGSKVKICTCRERRESLGTRASHIQKGRVVKFILQSASYIFVVWSLLLENGDLVEGDGSRVALTDHRQNLFITPASKFNHILTIYLIYKGRCICHRLAYNYLNLTVLKQYTCTIYGICGLLTGELTGGP